MKTRILAVAIALIALALFASALQPERGIMGRIDEVCRVCAGAGALECGTCGGGGGREEACCACGGAGELSCGACRERR